jgi:hypothetical protein
VTKTFQKRDQLYREYIRIVSSRDKLNKLISQKRDKDFKAQNERRKVRIHLEALRKENAELDREKEVKILLANLFGRE